MKRKKEISLRGLIRRLMLSFGLALAGSWGIIATRLNIEAINDLVFTDPMNQFYTDLVSLTVVLLGLFLMVYYRLRLSPRLKRMEDLGEALW